MLIASAGAQVARRYGLPSLSWVSSDSKTVNGQSILEKAMSITVHMLAGNSLIWGLGNMESQASMSLEQTIIDEEIVRPVKRLREGVEVNMETIALEAVKRVGVGGNFLSEKHTSTHYLREHVQTTVLDRSTREVWVKKGSTTLMDRVKAKLNSILESHQPTPMDEDLKRTLREIVYKADRGTVRFED
jgi:trimethylamine--corrinoid protein Co-methyltransferase